jgi:hypothetical protein
MGCPSRRDAVVTASPRRSISGSVPIMAEPREIAPAGLLLTQADFASLVRELESLRSDHRSELAAVARAA